MGGVRRPAIVSLSVNLASRWFLAVMPSSEEESQWLVGSGGGLAPSGGSATKTVAGERGAGTRSGLYTEEMTTQPASVAAAGANSASADSAEHDLIDSTADATLLAQFHEDAIKQVNGRPVDAVYVDASVSPRNFLEKILSIFFSLLNHSPIRRTEKEDLFLIPR